MVAVPAYHSVFTTDVDWSQEGGTWGLSAFGQSRFESTTSANGDTLTITMINNKGFWVFFCLLISLLLAAFIGILGLTGFRLTADLGIILIPLLIGLFVAVMSRTVAPAEQWIFRKDGSAELRTK